MNYTITVQPAQPEQMETVREMFRKYAEAFDYQCCFETLEEELKALPGEYTKSAGGLLLVAQYENKIAGCVALRKITDDVCEMKRLWVRPDYRGKQIGVALVQKVIPRAKKLGYLKITLETIPLMEKAIAMYDKFGFIKTGNKGEIILMELNLV